MWSIMNVIGKYAVFLHTYSFISNTKSRIKRLKLSGYIKYINVKNCF